MTRPLLLDTCAVLWIAEDAPLSDAAVAAMDEAYDEGIPVYVSPITAWEIGALASRGKWTSVLSPARWFERLIQESDFRLSDMLPDLLIASWFLPGNIVRDPADRIIVATARERDLILITRDRALIDYARQGHIRLVAC